jgi:hypothetical protein
MPYPVYIMKDLTYILNFTAFSGIYCLKDRLPLHRVKDLFTGISYLGGTNSGILCSAVAELDTF